MGNDITIKIASTEDVTDNLKKISGQSQTATSVIVRGMGDSGDAFDTAARSSGKLGSGLDMLSGASSQLSGGLGDLGDGLQSVVDFQNRGAEKAREYARKQIDVEQAMEDTQQAAEDLKQAQLDLNQSVIDGRQAQVDFEQAQIDQKQALLDASTAQQAYNDAVKQHGASSAEAQQAAIDLTQAQADLKQANLDADQAIADQAQATADGAQATRDMSQANIDAKGAQVDLNEAQQNAKPPGALQQWSSELGAFTPLIAAATGAIDLMILANKALTAEVVKNTVVQASQKVATIAGSVATGVATAAQWLWNVAMTANPIGIIIVAIGALIAIIVLIATKTTWFQDAWKWTWAVIKASVEPVWDWIKNTLWPGIQWVYQKIVDGVVWVKNMFVSAWDGVKSYLGRVWDYLTSLPGKLGAAFDRVTGFITAPFRAAFNAVSRLWNSTIGHLSWTVPGWVPFIGGNSISAPRLPTLHTGGDVLRTGAAIVRAGERIQPATTAGLGGGSTGKLTILVDLAGGSEDLRRWVKKNTRFYGGGGPNSVQLAWAGDTV